MKPVNYIITATALNRRDRKLKRYEMFCTDSIIQYKKKITTQLRCPVWDGGVCVGVEECNYPSAISWPQLERVFFYCTEKQTASLSNYDYLTPVTLRMCSALYRLFLNGWNQAQIVIEVCFKCVSVSSVLQVLSNISQHQNKLEV